MKHVLLAPVVAAAVFSAAPASAAVVVSMDPASQSVAVGDTIIVDVRISGLGTDILSAFDLDVVFNTGLTTGGGASLLDAEFGGANAGFDADASTPGVLKTVGYSLLNDDDLAAVQTNGAFTFLRMSWTAAADGALLLNFGASPDFARNVVGRDFLSLDASFAGACVAIGTGICKVPEPGSFGLAGLALFGCAAAVLRRPRRGAATTAATTQA
ncbi:MAG TPA: PEP-CTERM sorting domain-containing protein [Aquabacterium sp.]|nr:PEP-CTERM sorting domain-containing protein [Aquabacterium sp.]HQC97560.1 PEP-CTERM sorting domain-containing protein [Aquabacterium sp.]